MKLLLCLLLFTLSAGAANVRVEDVPERGVQPQVVVDTAGTAHLIYLKGDAQHTDVRYVRRAKGVRAWSAPVAVNNEPGTAVAMGTIRGAQLALGQKGTLHVVWNGAMKPGTGGAAQGMPLYYTRLEPGQTTFAPQRNLLGETGALDGGASIAADEKGDVFAVWHGKAPGAAAGETWQGAGRGGRRNRARRLCAEVQRQRRDFRHAANRECGLRRHLRLLRHQSDRDARRPAQGALSRGAYFDGP
jgi:hypothetical protein